MKKVDHTLNNLKEPSQKGKLILKRFCNLLFQLSDSPTKGKEEYKFPSDNKKMQSNMKFNKINTSNLKEKGACWFLCVHALLFLWFERGLKISGNL